jgi:hypothetical protein
MVPMYSSPKELILWKDIYINGYTAKRVSRYDVGATDAGVRGGKDLFRGSRILNIQVIRTLAL